MKIVDEHDKTVGPDAIGEICVRGAHVMKGYWKNPKLTAEVLRGGWYHTGDMGYQDRDGYIYLTDRKADMIISGGENVYPREVEDVHLRPSRGQGMHGGVITRRGMGRDRARGGGAQRRTISDGAGDH